MVERRTEYSLGTLLEKDCDPDPVKQFARWFDDVLAANLAEPYALTLATATPDGKPSARIVLLRGWDARGFVFFTNYQSRKGQELAANPHAAMTAFWPQLERQVRIEGDVSTISDAESDQYHRERPRGSQMGAWCSFQSDVIPGREILEERLRELEQRFAGVEVPRPPHWGGYRLAPQSVEFWQGRPSRLHDRIRYRLAGGNWLIERLSP